jgi:predicted short-subunit dehydrogenase-like oxidoreductase (DUF2520 family)
MNLGIVGSGRAAWAFGSAWKALGRPISGLHARAAAEAAALLGVEELSLEDLVRRSEIIVLAVSDAAIAEVATRLSARVSPEVALFHPSGSLSSDVFAPHSRRFSLHPMRSLPHPGEPLDFRDTLFTFEGAAEAESVASDFVEQVGGRFCRIDKTKKTLYHAAAVFASNYVATLLEIARDLLRESGVTAEAREQLAALARSAIDNWLRREFTGPVARGDRDVIAGHIEALRHHLDEAELYQLLASALSKALQRKEF